MIQRIITLPEDSSYFLLGPRQTGKSTLIRSILPENSWQINLLEGDTYLRYLRAPELFRREALDKIRHDQIDIIFVDEIQRIPALLNEIQLLIDQTQCRFIMTGSSARKLKRGGANLLAGRAVQRFLGTFVYEEIKSYFNLEAVLKFGTLPALHEKNVSEKIDILNAYAEVYLKEEIQSEGIVRHLAGFARFLEIAASTFSEMVNYSNIARECGIPARSVQGYYDILEDTLLGFRLPAWHQSSRKRLRSHPKFYFFDNGVVNSLNHAMRDDPGRIVRGRLFEQWLINEVRTKIHYLQSDHQLYYWQTAQGAEVDLILVRGQRMVAAFEIKTASVIHSSHLSGLRSFHEDYPQVPRYTISEVPNSYELDGVRILPWNIFLTQALPDLLK